MARSAARLKMGYYPLPESEGANLRKLLSFTGPASVVDPCVGQGTALNLLTQGAEARRYGVELDAERAMVCADKHDSERVLVGGGFTVLQHRTGRSKL